MSYYSEKRIRHWFPDGEKVYIGVENEFLRNDFLHLRISELLNGNHKPKLLWIVEQRGKIPEISEWIGKFPTIEALMISRDLIPFGNVKLDNLRTFSLASFQNEHLADNYMDYLWLENQTLPNVAYFSYLDAKLNDLGGLTPVNLPNLEWLECRLDEKGKKIEAICKFEHLKALSISSVRNYDVFSIMGDQLEILSLSGFSKGFPMHRVTKFANLEVLSINGYRQDLDIEWLLDMNLKEIELRYCLKIINTEALLKMKSLENISIIDCKNALSCELKSILKERNYRIINI